jgi:hypothetical protein
MTIRKDRDNKWEGADDINLGIVPGAGDKPIILQIRTSVDSRRGARTTATALHDEGNGGLTHVFSFGERGDFSKTVRINHMVTRGTEKAVTAAHALAMGDLPEIIGMVELFYGGRAPQPAPATNRPGDQAAVYAEETGVSYSEALVACNMD